MAFCRRSFIVCLPCMHLLFTFYFAHRLRVFLSNHMLCHYGRHAACRPQPLRRKSTEQPRSSNAYSRESASNLGQFPRKPLISTEASGAEGRLKSELKVLRKGGRKGLRPPSTRAKYRALSGFCPCPSPLGPRIGVPDTCSQIPLERVRRHLPLSQSPKQKRTTGEVRTGQSNRRQVECNQPYRSPPVDTTVSSRSSQTLVAEVKSGNSDAPETLYPVAFLDQWYCSLASLRCTKYDTKSYCLPPGRTWVVGLLLPL